MVTLLGFLTIIFTTVHSTPITIINAETSDVEYRLPEIAKPLSYDIHLILPSETFTSASDDFTGDSRIVFTVSAATSDVKLHASHAFLTIIEVAVNSIAPDNISFTLDNATDILTVSLANGNVLNPNVNHMLYFKFNGKLSTSDMYGFYKSSYQGADNQTKYLATTQFEPVYARRSFPCFDEPSFKATFDVYITYPKELNILGNTDSNIVDDSLIPIGVDKETTTTVKFDTTPKMSTYLLAYIISEFTCSSGENVEEFVPSRVCSRKEAESSRNFAVTVSTPLLRSLNDFVNHNYSLSLNKMDQVAIPDFAAGAMENWGLVTYRETRLLWDEAESSTSARQSVAAVIAHEFAHQWFGNLVTMNWWSETFLNEGFATYFEHFTTHDVLPEWEMDKQFVVRTVQYALEADSLESSQALQSSASTPAEISGKFGTISYSKGGSILRMVEHILGHENFKSGVQNYIQQNLFSNTEPEDLWRALNETTNTLPVTLEILMENWVKTSGFPVLTVRKTNDSNNIEITQERFLFTGSNTTSKWYVPITYTTNINKTTFEDTLPKYWLTPTQNAEITYPEGATWIILNNQATGYYRIQYEADLWNAISEALLKENFDGVPELNRAQLVDDAFNLARANKLQYSTVFNVARFLENELSYHVWYPAFSGFNYLLRRVGADSYLGQSISAHLLDLSTTLYNNVTVSLMTDENHLYTIKSSLALSWACSLGKTECVELVTDYFAQFYNGSQKPPKNLRSLVYCNGLRYSENSQDWEYLWETYLATDDANEKNTLLSALGCSKNESILENYLSKTITEASGIRAQDALSAFSAVYRGSTVGVDVAFKFLIRNYDNIAESYQSMNSLVNIVRGLAGYFTTQDQVNELERFITEENLTDAFKKAAQEALEDAKTNLAWLALFEDDLNDYYSSPTTSTESETTTTESGSASVNKIATFLMVSSVVFVFIFLS